MLPAAGAILLLCAATYMDLRARKIPNWISLLGALFGAFVLVLSNRDRVGELAGILLLALILGAFAYRLWIGWGDVKLLCVLAIILGIRLTLYGLLYA